MDPQRLTDTARGLLGALTRRAQDAASAVIGGSDVDELLQDPLLVTSLERYAVEHDEPLELSLIHI